MNTLKKFFTGKKGHINKDQIENYYGHGAREHKHHEHAHGNNEHHHHQGTKYQCPMKCEVDKVYDSPGNCPVCNMKLEPVDHKSSHEHRHHCC